MMELLRLIASESQGGGVTSRHEGLALQDTLGELDALRAAHANEPHLNTAWIERRVVEVVYKEVEQLQVELKRQRAERASVHTLAPRLMRESARVLLTDAKRTKSSRGEGGAEKFDTPFSYMSTLQTPHFLRRSATPLQMVRKARQEAGLLPRSRSELGDAARRSVSPQGSSFSGWIRPVSRG